MACCDCYSGHPEVQKTYKMGEVDYQMDQSFPMVWNYLPFTHTYIHSLITLGALDLQSKENSVFSMNSMVGLLLSFRKLALSESV